MMRLIKNIFFIGPVHNAIPKKDVGIFYFFLGLFLTVYLSSPAYAAKVMLKSGKTLEGTILQMDEETLTLQNAKGEKSQVVRSLIDSIAFTDSVSSGSAAILAPPSIQGTKEDKNPPAPTSAEATKTDAKTLSPQEMMLQAPSEEDAQLFERVFNGANSIEMKKGPYASPKHTFETWRQASIKGDLKKMVKSYASFRQKQVSKQLKKIPRKQRKEMQEVSNDTMFSLGEVYYEGNRASMEVTWNRGLSSDTQTLKFILENQQWKLIQ